jgi:hypothetical protein
MLSPAKCLWETERQRLKGAVIKQLTAFISKNEGNHWIKLYVALSFLKVFR